MDLRKHIRAHTCTYANYYYYAGHSKLNTVSLQLFKGYSLPTAAVSLQTTASCPSGWMVHANKCYHFNHDTETWADAMVRRDIIYHYKL